MYVVRYTIADDDTVLVAFAKAKSADEARCLVYPQLMVMYEKFNIVGVERTSMNVFVNPESCSLGF